MLNKYSSHQNAYPLKGNTARANSLPIFKLLQAFKLQQYAKIFADLGYGFEVYKVALLLPRQRHDLLNKLNLLPGHRARFLSLFEIIDQIYPREEKFKMLRDAKKSSRIKPEIGSSGLKKIPENDHGKSAGRKKRSLMRHYNMLDNKSKRDINETFLRKIKENKPGIFQNNQNLNIQNVLDKHVSKSKTRKAMKKIFPPSMYDKFSNTSSNSRSRSKKRGFSAKQDQKVNNIMRRN